MSLNRTRRFLLLTLANVASWVLVALVATDVLLGAALRDGRELNWALALREQLRYWLPWSLIVWCLFRLTRRLDRKRSPVLRSVLVHLVLYVAWTLLFAFYLTLPLAGSLEGSLHSERSELLPWLGSEALIYLALVGITQGHLLYRRFTEQARQAAELREQLTRAELDVLRGQLDPHFLFNSLNTVAALVRTQDSAGALAAIARLGELLRASLASHQRSWVTMQEEIDIAASYLELQKLRFGESLQVEMQVDEDCAEAWVPGMLLLPLVENAVRHGAVGSVPQQVALKVWREDRSIHVQLQNHLSEEPAEPGSGMSIGLQTTRERLRRLFGPDASLGLDLSADSQVRTLLRLPHRSEPELTGDDCTPAREVKP